MRDVALRIMSSYIPRLKGGYSSRYDREVFDGTDVFEVVSPGVALWEKSPSELGSRACMLSFQYF